MKALTFISALMFSALFVSGNSVLAQGNSQGHGHGKGHEKHADADDQGNHEGYGYEQKRLYPVPVELARELPPPPPDCANVLISGRVVLLNRKTNLIVDVFAF